jgi:hypothetical protein
VAPRIDARPVMAVAHLLDNGNVHALLYQKDISGDFEDIAAFRNVIEDLGSADVDPPDWARHLEQCGLFRAETLLLTKESGYHTSLKDRTRLRRFVHSPRWREGK